MSLLTKFGKKQMEIASRWLSSAATYGAVSGILVIYFTDWRVVTDYIPFYRGKYVAIDAENTE
ncbi:hypothetical protein ABEB36_001201 [Hypothenemus hampei]|uniref:Cytochrome b-c1 complex subunit 10 n=1 Tax=Hypothenemus hampei TaxID=57062 RepID=A0ABD1FH22_HYPHA